MDEGIHLRIENIFLKKENGEKHKAKEGKPPQNKEKTSNKTRP